MIVLRTFLPCELHPTRQKGQESYQNPKIYQHVAPGSCLHFVRSSPCCDVNTNPEHETYALSHTHDTCCLFATSPVRGGTCEALYHNVKPQNSLAVNFPYYHH